MTLRLTEADDEVRVLVQHAKLGGDEQREAMAKLWDAALERLEEVINFA